MNHNDYIQAEHRIFGIHKIIKGTCGCGDVDCKAIGKHPVASNYQHSQVWSEEQLDTMELMGHFDTGFGVLVDGLLVVDVDARNGGVESFNQLCKDLETDLLGGCEFAVKTGSGNGSMHLYFKAPSDVSLRSKHDDYKGIDFKSSGYVIGCGSLHASGQEYELIHGSPDDVCEAPSGLIELITRPAPVSLGEGFTGSSEVDIEEIKTMLSFIDPDSDYNDWIKVGMALHHNDKGHIDLWDEWSAKGHKYEGFNNIEKHWNSFGASANPVTVGSIIHYAEAGGYVPSAAVVIVNKSTQNKDDFFHGTSITLDDMINPPPPREYYITGFLAEGIVTIIGGEGGIGKSRFALQMAISLASGSSFFGYDIKRPEKVLYLSAEDDLNECKRRIHQIVTKRDELSKKGGWLEEYQVDAFNRDLIAQNLMIKDLVGEGFFFTATEKGGIAKTTKQFEEVKEQINARPDVKIIIIDTYSRFNGGTENSNDDAVQFVKACEKLLKGTNRTIIIIAHTVKSNSKDTLPDVDKIAGGKRFTDSGRLTLLLDRYMKKSITDSMEGPELNRIMRQVRISAVKNNYAPELPEYMYTEVDEYFKPCTPAHDLFKKPKETKSVTQYDTVSKLVIKELSKAPKSKNAMEKLSGTDTKYGVSGKVLLQIIAKMIENELVEEVKNPKAKGNLLQVVSGNQVNCKVLVSQ
jgi:RecA-family ATPase